jgi:hypothetical protein
VIETQAIAAQAQALAALAHAADDPRFSRDTPKHIKHRRADKSGTR